MGSWFLLWALLQTAVLIEKRRRCSGKYAQDVRAVRGTLATYQLDNLNDFESVMHLGIGHVAARGEVR